MYSVEDYTVWPVQGCPIRESPDQRLLAASRSLSQLATPFIAHWRQGIHRKPFCAWSINSQLLLNDIQLSKNYDPLKWVFYLIYLLNCLLNCLLNLSGFKLVEVNGLEPSTPCVQGRCSPSWATPPKTEYLTAFLTSSTKHNWWA
jgi:hypothetical protein